MSGIHFYTIFSGVYGNLHPIVCSKLHLIEARRYSRELPKISFWIPSNAIAFRGMISILFCCLTTRIRSLMIEPARKCLWSSNRHEMKQFTTQQRKWQDEEMKEKVFSQSPGLSLISYGAPSPSSSEIVSSAGLIQFQFSVMIWLLSVST